MENFFIGSILFFALGIATEGFSQNIKMTDSLIKLVEDKGTSDTTLIFAYNDLGVQYATSDFDKAKKFIGEAIRLSEKNGHKRGMAGAENCLGIVYYYAKEYDSALVHYGKALAINRELGHQWGQASALYQMGVIYKYKAEFKLAITYFQKTKDLFEQSNDSISLAKSLESIGACYNAMRYSAKAMEYYLNSIKIYEQKQNKDGIIRGYQHIGIMLILKEEYKSALDYLNKALPFTEEGGNRRMISYLYALLAKSHIGLGDYDKAMEYANLSLKQSELLGSEYTGSPLTFSYIGETYMNLKDYPKALKYFNRALRSFPKKDSLNISVVYTHNVMAKTYEMVRELDSAISNAQRAVKLSQAFSHLKGEIEGKTTLARIAEIKGDRGQAYEHFKSLMVLKDSLTHIENRNHMEELRTIYETDRRERQLQRQKLKVDMLEQEVYVNKVQRIALMVGLALLIVVSFLLVYIGRQKAKESRLKARYSDLEKVKLGQELGAKQRELTSIALNLAKKNKVMLELKQILGTSMKDFEEEGIKEGEKQVLLRKINEELKDDDNWEYFKQSFEQVHPDFYTEIKQKYPGLTQNDLRMLAFLKMNLSYREIGNILNITTDGIKKARYRLRKKMNIDSDDSLHDVVFG
ncbi:tetratricopeptide repeat protein [Allomuricauda taeanensis]|uniref:tetratricopeptide repeat protein n=1 Tax=Flagellimonas taeanensis TaxID=1005926 RepID=UPI002E7BD355|nr:tetratricopeptide repeat protein [Allomuricauda taeanensis]MEE1964570.1 tetratricopeptide repeat protein [Allomuricauda taeanensis]